MAIKCPECSNKFTMREALCEDWADPDKSFGCPHCGTFFVKDMRPSDKKSLIPTIFMVGVFLPVINILFQQFYHGGNSAVTLQASFAAISCLVIATLSALRMFSPLKKSPYSEPKTDPLDK